MTFGQGMAMGGASIADALKEREQERKTQEKLDKHTSGLIEALSAAGELDDDTAFNLKRSDADTRLGWLKGKMTSLTLAEQRSQMEAQRYNNELNQAQARNLADIIAQRQAAAQAHEADAEQAGRVGYGWAKQTMGDYMANPENYPGGAPPLAEILYGNPGPMGPQTAGLVEQIQASRGGVDDLAPREYTIHGNQRVAVIPKTGASYVDPVSQAKALAEAGLSSKAQATSAAMGAPERAALLRRLHALNALEIELMQKPKSARIEVWDAIQLEREEIKKELAGQGQAAPAAPAAPKYAEGTVAINRQTGEKRVFQNGNWVPLKK